jgi:hypothetical protein
MFYSMEIEKVEERTGKVAVSCTVPKIRHICGRNREGSPIRR